MTQFSRILLSLLIVSTVVLVPSCMSNQNVSEQKKNGLVVINVLKKELYDDCHIEGSLSMPFDQAVELVQKSVDKDAEIVVYCSNYMCTASGMVCKQLKALGYNKVCAYEAGIAEWYQQGLPTKGAAKSGYLNYKLEKPDHNNSDVCVITTQELADKLKLKKIE